MQSNKLLLFVFIILFAFKASYGQQNPDYYTKFNNILFNDTKIHNHKSSSYRGLLGFYKKHISSQDFGHCPYYPSCSSYTFQSIKKKGILLGIIQGLDRLSRCNRNQNEHYLHTKNNKLIDLP